MEESDDSGSESSESQSDSEPSFGKKEKKRTKRTKKHTKIKTRGMQFGMVNLLGKLSEVTMSSRG